MIKRWLRWLTSRGPQMTDVQALEIILTGEKIQRYSLQLEVLDHYVTYRQHGDQPTEALGCALWDWDL